MVQVNKEELTKDIKELVDEIIENLEEKEMIKLKTELVKVLVSVKALKEYIKRKGE